MLLCPLTSPLPTLSIMCLLPIDQTFPMGRNTCSTMKGPILPAPLRQLLER